MSTTTLPSLGSLAGALGSIAGLETSLDIQQFNCVKNNLEKYFELSANSAQKYEIYPAIAASDTMVKEAANSIDKVFRQGILVKTTDTNEWYYIGGVSPYWSAGNLIVYQGGSKAKSQGKINKRLWDSIINKTGGIVAIPLQKTRSPEKWYNPTIFNNCKGTFGLFWNYLAEFQVGFLPLLSHAPDLLLVAEAKRISSFAYTSSGHYYLSRGAEDLMRTASDTYPYIYGGLGPNPVIAKSYHLEVYPYFTFDSATQEVQSICKSIMPSSSCSLALDYIKFNDIDVGAPVLSSIPCDSSCSTFGLAGLVLSISPLSIKNYQAIYLRVVQPPSSFTSSGILEWVKLMDFVDIFNLLLEGSRKYKKAISSLSSVYPEFIAIAAALTVAWVELSYDDGLKQAEKKASELKGLYDKLVEELAGKAPPISDRYLYKEWRDYKDKVENCARDAILDHPEATYDELKDDTLDCAGAPDY